MTTQTNINGWALTWGDDDTPRAPALPVRCLEDELTPPGQYLDLAAEAERQREKQAKRRLAEAKRNKQRAQEKKASTARILAMRLSHT